MPKTSPELGAPEHRLNVPDKPSTMFHGDLYVVRVYCDNSMDGQVYTHVKHLWIKRDVLCICHFYEDETYRFVYFPLAVVHWFQMIPERFENAR